MVAGLKKEHPRLLLKSSVWVELNAQRKVDPVLHQFLNTLEAMGTASLDAPTAQYELTGKRLLTISRKVMKRVLLWSVNYRITGNPKFLQRAEQEMLAVAEFKDWHPVHYLDTAEMTAALALGYDWLYDQLPAASREKIREAIVTKGLKTLTSPENPGFVSWQTRANNWNQVCFGGLVLGALAVGDEEPDLANRVLSLARTNNFHGMRPYAPDGVFPEGPSYWNYGTTYEVLMIAGLESALGTDWDLAASPGFLQSAEFVLQTTAPGGRVFNYSDGGERVGVQPAPFWFARRMHNPGLVAEEAGLLRTWLSKESSLESKSSGSYLSPLIAVWWLNPEAKLESKSPLAWKGGGAQPLAVFRSAWNDPNAMWLALKGGSPSLSHAHMDAGSFVFESDGERWASDLGMQDYNSLESKKIDLWNGKQTGARWTVFRLNNQSHNVVMVNHQPQRVDGSARIVRFSGLQTSSVAVLDLSPVFAGQASRVMRGFSFRPGKGVLVRDELEGLKPGDDVRWAMVTRAIISTSGAEATLEQNGKKLSARIISPANAHFESIPADPPVDDFNAPNPGARLLIVNTKATESGRVEVNVALTPGSFAFAEDPLASKPLVGWPGEN